MCMEVEEGSGTEVGCSISILDSFKAPARSDIARKRLIEKPKTTGVDNKRKTSVPNQTNPKTVSLSACVKEFPGECLMVWHSRILFRLETILL